MQTAGLEGPRVLGGWLCAGEKQLQGNAEAAGTSSRAPLSTLEGQVQRRGCPPW